MAVKIEDVKYIAKLCKLSFKDDELEQYTNQLNDILCYMDKLNEIDTTGVEPLSHPIEKTNVFREDVVKNEITCADALRNAPQNDDQFFKVPKVIHQ